MSRKPGTKNIRHIVLTFREIDLTEKEIARFCSRYEVLPSGCWRWTGKTNPPPTKPYGRFSHMGRQHYAHRLSYLIHRGEIAEGMQVDHLCRNAWCVCPDHLEPVTAQENMHRGESPAARAFREGICRRGHPRAGSNLKFIKSSGGYACRTCINENSRAHRRRQAQGAAR